jgi:hypothetical protein
VVAVGSFFGSLDKHQGAAVALMTAALVLVTAFYAVQNYRMVAEMQRSRGLAILPKLAVEFHRLGPTAMTVAIKNVGPGAALAVDVRLMYDPLDHEQFGPQVRWRRSVLAPGEQSDFMPPGGVNDSVNTLPNTYRSIRLVGSMLDAAGNRHNVEERLENLREWRGLLHAAHERWVDPDRERRLAGELESASRPRLGSYGRRSTTS